MQQCCMQVAQKCLEEAQRFRYSVSCDVTMTSTSAFGELIKYYRSLQGLSLRQIEDQIGMSATNVSRIERGLVGPPPSDVIERIARALDAPIDQLKRAAGIMVNIPAGDIDLEEAILLDDTLDEDERTFLLQALRLVRARPGKKR